MSDKTNAAKMIPDWLRATGVPSPVLFLDVRGKNLNLDDPGVQSKVARKLIEMQAKAAPVSLPGPALIKVHIGEPLIVTSIIPRLANSSVEFLKSKGVTKMAFGDTTVLYSSRRGGKENPHGQEKSYLELARERGWASLDAPFVILDRPATSVAGMFEFDTGAIDMPAGQPGRFPDVHAAGAVPVAKSLVQHAHMTGHMLTGLACCIKGIAMGLANRRGKAQMHLSLRPKFADELCNKCGSCAETCPENALDFTPGETPRVDDERCLGCGQCMAECEQSAIAMKAVEKYDNYDWDRGADTIHWRMVDYAVGLMQGFWNTSVHVAHLMRMTPHCDCYNAKQTPVSDDIGFLVGANPFAVDKAATDLFVERISRFAEDEMQRKINVVRRGDPFGYALKTYQISSEYKLETVAL